MQFDINWTTIISYLLALGGAWVLGQPLLMKGIDKAKSLFKSKSVTVTADDDVEELLGDVESEVAGDLLRASFYFKDTGNQAGVELCLKTLAEITRTQQTIKEIVQE